VLGRAGEGGVVEVDVGEHAAGVAGQIAAQVEGAVAPAPDVDVLEAGSQPLTLASSSVLQFADVTSLPVEVAGLTQLREK
jgi:hypothetical protein